MRPQDGKLLIRKLKHEIRGKLPQVAPDLLIEAFGLDTIKQGKVSIENHALPSNYENSLGNPRNRPLEFTHTEVPRLEQRRGPCTGAVDESSDPLHACVLRSPDLVSTADRAAHATERRRCVRPFRRFYNFVSHPIS